MNTEQFERANEIQERVSQLNRVKECIEANKNIYILASGMHMSDSVKISTEVENTLYMLLLGEIAKLNKEFEEL